MSTPKLYGGIDPSTKTGLVLLDEMGRPVLEKEIHLPNGIRSTDGELMAYGRKIVDMIPKGTVVCMEDFSFGSQGQAVSTQYGVGFSIRYALLDAGIVFTKPTPSQVKKYATGKGNSKKDAMVLPIFRQWGFEHSSDNVRDAFVLAQIALGQQNFKAELLSGTYPKYQLEVLGALEEKKSQ